MARDRTPDGTTGGETGRRHILQCSWLADSCPMPASWFSHGDRPGLCSWHAWVAQEPKRNTFNEFEEFCFALVRYCCPWSHYSPVALWQYMAGQRSTLPAPAPCELSSCVHAPVEVTDAEVQAFRDAIRAGRDPFQRRTLDQPANRDDRLAMLREQAEAILRL